jgi:hypothetical protein
VALTVRVLLLFVPALDGRNATTTVQLAAAASVGPQVFETVNSAALVPLSAAARAVVVPAATPPTLVTVRLRVALVLPATVSGKLTTVALTVSVAGVNPVPVRADVAVPPGVAVTDSDPVFCPALAGTNLTAIVQVELAVSTRPLQPSVAVANSIELLMLAVTGPVGVPPVFVTVKLIGVPTAP